MNLSPLPIQKFFDNNGRPLVGGQLFTYEAGTSNKVATYTDSSGGTPNTNPVILNFRGECNLWIDPQQAYKFILSPSDDSDPPTNPIWAVDNITAAPQAFDNASVDIGSINNISLNIPQISSPVAFTRVVFQAANTNTGATTLQINGGTANPVKWQSAVILSGQEIRAGGIYEAIYDGANWQLQGPTLDPCDLRLFGGIPDGTTDCSAALIAASTASAAGKGPIVIKGGTYRIADNVAIARGAILSFNGGVLSIDNTFILTISGAIQAGRAQVFSGLGTVSIVFGGEANTEIYPEWWGAVPDGVFNCSHAINAAITAAHGSIISFAAGVYSCEGLNLGSASSFYGVSKDETILKSRTATYLMRLAFVPITECQLTIKDLTVDGNSIGTNGIELTNAARFSIRDVKITSFALRGIYSTGSILYQVIRTEIKNCDVGWDAVSGASNPNAITLRDCSINGSVSHAVRVRSGSLIIIDSCDIEGCGTPGSGITRAIDIDNMDPDGLGISIVIRGAWMELNNGLSAINIGTPASAYSLHVIEDTQIFAGTRTYGINVEAGPPGVSLSLHKVVVQNSGTTDILIGAGNVGSLMDSRCGTYSTASSDFTVLKNPVTNEYNLGRFFGVYPSGLLQLNGYPGAGSYANDAAAAAAGYAVGQVYRNGSALQVRVT